MDYIFYIILFIIILFLVYQLRIAANNKKKLENKIEEKTKEISEIQNEKIRYETLYNESKSKSETIDEEREKVIESFQEYFNSSLINQFSDATERSNKKILETAKNTFDAATKLSKEQFSGIIKPINTQTEEVKTSLSNIKSEYGKVTTYLDSVKNTMNYVHTSTRDLSNALKGDNQAIGTWGEESLERIFIRNGLTKNVDFFHEQIQASGAKPDFILEVRNNEKIIFDSKNSIKNFLDAANETDPKIQERLFREHSRNIREKVKTLIRAKYPDQVKDAMDVVIMYVPNENALLKALETDKSLFEYAYENNIILMSSSNILVLLQQIHSFKKYSKANDSVKKILAGVDVVIKHLNNTHSYIETLGSSITSTKDNYNRLIGNVENSVLPSFKKLHSLRHNKEYNRKTSNTIEGDTRKIDSKKLDEIKKITDS